MATYSNRELTKDIADWFNNSEEAKILNLFYLSKLIGAGCTYINDITGKRNKSINPKFLEKLLPIILVLGFTSNHIKLDFGILKKEICAYFDILENDIETKNREGSIPIARKFIAKYSYEKLKISQIEIGRKIGKHHSTITIAIKTLNNWIERDYKVKNYFIEIEKRLKMYA